MSSCKHLLVYEQQQKLHVIKCEHCGTQHVTDNDFEAKILRKRLKPLQA